MWVMIIGKFANRAQSIVHGVVDRSAAPAGYVAEVNESPVIPPFVDGGTYRAEVAFVWHELFACATRYPDN